MGRRNKLKFVEGSVTQLARVLYSIHEENGAQPETAILEAIKTFGDDVDRNKILNAARSSAEALTRKQKSLQSNAKFKPTMTVAEKAKELKTATILKLYLEMEDAWDASQEPGSSSTLVNQFRDTYESLRACREQLKEDILNDDYSTEEIDQAAFRLEKIKKIDSRGGSESENSIPLMKGLWLQLVQALLLQKDDKNHPTTPTTFEGTPTADKGPIGSLAREECANLNRLKLISPELIRSFAERCKFEFRFCTWLRMLHEPPPSRDASFLRLQSELKKQIDEDMDKQLYLVLSSALPFGLAYMRSTIDVNTRVGAKFSALCLAIEGEADFQSANINPEQRISFLDSHRQREQEDHTANVTLTTRIAKDPKGVPVSENISESYRKEVSTNFRLKESDKRRRNEDDEEPDEKEESPSVHAINSELLDINADLLKQIMVLQKTTDRLSARKYLPCFDFENKGKCEKDPCPFMHAENSKSSSSSSRSSNTSLNRSQRARNKSPLRESEPSHQQSRFARHQNRSPQRNDGSPVHFQQRENYPLQVDTTDACESMIYTSSCADSDCQRYHGVSNLDPGAPLCWYTYKDWCPYLYSEEGCRFHHNQQRA